MKKIIVLLCVGLIGCATVAKESRTTSQVVKQPIVVNELEMDKIISIFSDEIEKNPDFSGGYYNRAIAYFYYQNNFEKCWRDVHKAESLGCKFSDNFLSALKEASNKKSRTTSQVVKQPIVINELEMDKIISIFSDEIEKNPDFSGGYYNRAIAYFYYQNNFDKCWRDVHKAESLGYKFSDDFLNTLKKASHREK